MDPGDNDEPSREELVERVDELEANQAEQREWWEDALPSRRGVLTAGAGLGLGALLSGSASGQSAAGQVGTPSSPEDVFAFDLDVQGALQRDLDAGGQAITNAESVSTEKQAIAGTVTTAKPEELQTTLSNASPGDTVVAVGGAHDPGSETTVPADVTLRFVGAILQPASPYGEPAFFLELGAELYVDVDLQFNTVSWGANPIVSVDTARTGGPYRGNTNDEVVVDLNVRGNVNDNPRQGTALELNADGGGITVGNRFRVNAKDCNVGIRGAVSSTDFITQNEVYFNGIRNETHILHENAGPWTDEIYGPGMDPGTQSKYAIRNTAGTSNSVTCIADVWDPTGYATNALDGPVHVINPPQPGNFQGNVSGEFDQMVTGWDANTYYVLNGGNQKEFNFNGPGDMFVRFNGSNIAELESNGDLLLGGAVFENAY